MTAVAGESPLDLRPVLEILESKSSSGGQVLEAYTKLAGHLTEGELSIFERDIVEQGKRLVVAAKKHAKGKGGVWDSAAQKALCVMGYCLNDKDIVSLLPDDEGTELLSLLSEIITESTERNTCSHALWCLSRQSLGSNIINDALPSLLTAIGKAAAKWWKASVVVEHEGLVAIHRLCEQCHQSMEDKCAEWGAILLRLTVSAAPKVRNQAMELAQEWAPVFAGNSDCMRVAASALKEHMKPELEAMFKNGVEMYVLKVCNFLLTLFKKQLHHRGTINSLLSILEMAFRVSSPEVRITAFRWWKTLIDIFDETNTLTNAKLVALVMRPFTTLNTPTEAVAMEKLVTWWHYVMCLDAAVWHHFDQVLKPLLQFCIGSTHLGSTQAGSAPGTPGQMNRAIQDGGGPAFRRSIGGADATPNMPSFPKVQKCGLEVLAHILRDPSKPASPAMKFTIDPLQTDSTISVGVFLKNANILISALFEFTKILTKTTPDTQFMHVWQCMTSHLRQALDTSRMERHEALSSFLTQFRDLVLNQVFPTHLILRVFQLVCSFPAKVLSSTAFGINSSEITKGCPAQFLCELLISLNLKDIDRQESFMTVFATLVRCGTFHPAGVLEFCQLVGQLLDQHAESMSSAEVLWRLWSVLANTLQEHISKTHEVNQGDSLEYNFECMYTVLILPISHRLGARVAQAVHKTAMKTWCLLYKTFARLSALVSNAEANVALEEFSHRVLNVVKADSYTKDLATLDCLLEICLTIVDTVDFSALTSANPFMQGLSLSTSPSPNPKKSRHHHSRPLGHLHSFVKLLSMLAQLVKDRLETEEKSGEKETPDQEDKRSSADTHLQAACTSIVNTVSVLVTHLTVPSVIGHMVEQLASPLAAVFHASSSKKNVAKLYQSPVFKQQLERLWQEVCTMLKQRYKGPYDSHLLEQLSSLLAAAFQHSRRQVKADTVQLWNATFGQASPPLNYPVDLLPVLSKVKEKTQLSLPGWVNIDVGVIEETPLSQMSQLDSQAPDPVIPGMPSPHRHGSFLHKDTSPKPSPHSPKRIVHRSENRLFGINPRKKLAVDFMSEKDFVVIKEAPKKRHVLTEHQKEILTEKRVLPAMYNNLDASQDRSLMSHFASGDTQQDSIGHSPVSDVIVVNSSQSQDLQPMGMASSNNQASSDTFLAPRRSSRRKSVRFDDSEQDTRDSENSITAASKKPQGSSKAAPVVETTEKITISSKSSSEDNIGEAEKSQNSSAPQPEASGLEAPISISSELSSSEEKRDEKAEEENDPFFRPFKSLSQTLPRTRSGGFETNSHDESPLLLRRKTRSQELITPSSNSANDAEAPSKSGPGAFTTTLEKWLKKSGDAEKPQSKPPAAGMPATEDVRGLFKQTKDVQKVTPPRCGGATLVEETQSPKKHAEKVSPSVNMSIQETPTKSSSTPGSSPVEGPSAGMTNLSVSMKEATSTTVNINQKDISSSFNLKEPLVQLERLGPMETELLAKPPLTTPPSSKEKCGVPFHLEESPPDLCHGTASQGFSPDQESEVSLHQSPVSAKQPEVTVIEDNVALDDDNLSGSVSLRSQASERRKESSEEAVDSIPLNHQTLFGFSELLEDMEGKADSDSDFKSADEEKNANKSNSSSENLSSEPRSYNPYLTATIQSTPPHPRPDAEESDATSSASFSPKPSQSQSISSSESSQNPSQQSLSESEVEFDPSKEATLQDRSREHSKKRKQSLPKKIADPQLLRRTSRKMRGKKSVCPCCKDKDGPRSHTHAHGSPSIPTPSRQKRQHDGEGKSFTPPKEGSSSRKRIRRSLSQGAANNSLEHPPSQKGRRSVSQGSVNNRSSAEPPIGQKTKQSSLGEKSFGDGGVDQTKTAYKDLGSKKPSDKPVELSPQDIGEKTPETKTSCTPLRHSTTKRKMEVAKRRSLSLPSSGRSRKVIVGSSESDSDDLPLSHTVAKLRKENNPSKTSFDSVSADVRTEVTEGGSQVIVAGSCMVEKSSKESVRSKVGKKNISPAKKEEPTRKNSPVLKRLSPSQASPKRGVSKLQLKRLAKHKTAIIRSPPKLRLRQRKTETSSQDEACRPDDSQTSQETTNGKAVKINEKALQPHEKVVKTDEKDVKTNEKASKPHEKVVKTDEKTVGTNELQVHLVATDTESSSIGVTKMKSSQAVVDDEEQDITTTDPSQCASEQIADTSSSMNIASCQSKEDQSSEVVTEKESKAREKLTSTESQDVEIASCQSKEDQSSMGIAEKGSTARAKLTSAEGSSSQATEQSAEGNAENKVEVSQTKSQTTHSRLRPSHNSRNHLLLHSSVRRRQQQRVAYLRSRKQSVFLRYERPRKHPPVTRSATAKAQGDEETQVEEFESNQLSLEDVGLQETPAEVEVTSEDSTQKRLRDQKLLSGSTSRTSSEKECSSGASSVTLERKGDNEGTEVNSEVEMTSVPGTEDSSSSMCCAEKVGSVTATTDDSCSVVIEDSEDIFADSCGMEALDTQMQQMPSFCVEQDAPAPEHKERVLDDSGSSSKDPVVSEGTDIEVSSEAVIATKPLPSDGIECEGDSGDLEVKGCDDDVKGDDDADKSLGFQAVMDQETEVEERDDVCTEDSDECSLPYNQAGLEDSELDELSPPEIMKGTCQDEAVNDKKETAADTANQSDDADVGDSLSSPKEELEETPASVDLQHVAMQTSPVVGKNNNIAVQTSPAKASLAQQPCRKMSKKEILDAIAESDVTPAEIIAALQVKTSRARRLFATCSTRLQGHLQGRGLAMVKQSMQLQKEQQKAGGYLAGRLGGQSLGRGISGGPLSSPRNVPPIIISSPSASPTSSILKRRGSMSTVPEVEEEELTTEATPQTPTPVKKRRVSFADPVISGESPAHEATLSKSPNYFKKDSPSKTTEPSGLKFVEFCPQKELSKVLNRQAVRKRVLDKIRTANQEVASSASPSQPSTSQQSQSSSSLQTPEEATPSQPTQNSYQSTQESQLDATKPIFPDLVDCTKPVDLILPQLTSSLWHRGLCQLMKARGVDSVGDLAKLTEVEVHSMPVRAPKVENVRTVLAAFHAQHYAKVSSSVLPPQPPDNGSQSREKSTTEGGGDNPESS